MHFPVLRYGNVQRIERTVDRHHPVLAHAPILAAHVGIFDEQDVVARKFGHRRGEIRLTFDQREVLAGMEARCAHEQRKRETGGREGGPRYAHRPRCDDTFERTKPSGIEFACRRENAFGSLITGAATRRAIAPLRSMRAQHDRHR